MSAGISVILCIVAGVLLLVGFLGTFVPVLPGAPLAWAGLLAAYFSEYTDISLLCLIITAVIAVVVSIVDSTTNQVIKQIPSEDMQKLKLRLRKAIGSMFDEVI